MIARYGSLAIFLAIVIVASALGSMFEGGEWYHAVLNKPDLWPASWLFALAWAGAYLALAIAAWQVWLTGHFSRNGALAWWLMLLVLNILWFFLFFGINRIGWSWLLTGVMLVVALLGLRAFRLISNQAGYLVMPYLAWMLYLSAANFFAWSKNGGIFGHLFY